MDELLAAKKNHTQSEKEKAVRFVRTKSLSLRDAAWLLKVSFSVIGDWNQGFDEEMRLLRFRITEGRRARLPLGWSE